MTLTPLKFCDTEYVMWLRLTQYVEARLIYVAYYYHRYGPLPLGMWCRRGVTISC